MPGCSITQCSARKSKDQPNLTLHSVPVNKVRRKQWLDVIGPEKINPRHKQLFICSLHFEESQFNRTLGVIRLREDAVPTLFNVPSLSQQIVHTPKENLDLPQNMPTTSEPIPTLCADGHVSEEQVTDSHEKDPLETHATLTNIAHAPVPGTSRLVNLTDQTAKIRKLEDKCAFLKKQVKRLNEKVRTQNKNIACFTNIIKDLREKNLVNNENSIVLEACAGPKHFLKKQTLTSEGLVLEKPYSEEARKFAVTLQLFSPKAYNFVRKTYNTCLPHPRIVTKWYDKINVQSGLGEQASATLKTKFETASNQ